MHFWMNRIYLLSSCRVTAAGIKENGPLILMRKGISYICCKEHVGIIKLFQCCRSVLHLNCRCVCLHAKGFYPFYMFNEVM